MALSRWTIEDKLHENGFEGRREASTIRLSVCRAINFIACCCINWICRFTCREGAKIDGTSQGRSSRKKSGRLQTLKRMKILIGSSNKVQLIGLSCLNQTSYKDDPDSSQGDFYCSVACALLQLHFVIALY